MPIFFTLCDIGSIDGVLADQFMEQVDGLILGFQNSAFEIAKWSTLVMGASILARSKIGGMRES